MKSLAGERVVITGAASGIGKLLALACARERADCALVDYHEERLADTERELKKFDVKVMAYRCDVSKREDIESTAGKILDDFDGVDILVNNAGIVSGGLLTDLEYEAIKSTIDVNLLGPMLFTKQVLPAMIQHGRGHIVNIASAAGLLGIPRLTDYCASKFGLVGFSDSLRLELKSRGLDGIKVTCVCPSYIGTGMFEGAEAPLLSPMLKPEDAAEQILRAIKKEKSYLVMPWATRLIPWVRLFPAAWRDRIANSLGVGSSMDSFNPRDGR